MRKFVISDLHGNGEVYDSIMAYLDNISLVDDVELYINGDVMDRGLDGFRMLEDIVSRMNGKGNVKVHYLGGNHELMMHQALKKRKPNYCVDHWSNWIQCGGWITEGSIEFLEDDKIEETYNFYRDFLGKLSVYKKFPEKIGGKPILLVHASSPKIVNDECSLKISDDNQEIEDIVWKREWIDIGLFFPRFGGENDLSKKGYFLIKGHTPIEKYPGFLYNKKQNYLNIDGGCAYYACGDFNVDHVPLVEVRDGYLNIFIFNHDNEIIDGYLFDGSIQKMSSTLVEKQRCFLETTLNDEGEKNRQKILEIINL